MCVYVRGVGARVTSLSLCLESFCRERLLDYRRFKKQSSFTIFLQASTTTRPKASMAMLSLGPGLLVLAAGFSATTYTDWYYSVDCTGKVSAERQEQLQICYWDGPTSWTSNCSANGSLIFRTYFHDPEPVAPTKRCLGKPTNVTQIVTGVCAALAGPFGAASSQYACKADDDVAADKIARLRWIAQKRSRS